MIWMKTPSLQSQKKISSFAQSLCSVWNVSTYWRVRRLCALFLLLPEASEKKKNLHIYFLNHILMVQNPFVIWRKNPTFRNCHFFNFLVKILRLLGFFCESKTNITIWRKNPTFRIWQFFSWKLFHIWFNVPEWCSCWRWLLLHW